MPPIKFRFNLMFQDFQGGHHGIHLGYWKGMNLAILNLHFNASHQDWAQSHLPFRSRHGLKIVAILDIRQHDYSNSESPSCSNASHEVSSQSDLWFGGRCRLMIFKMTNMAAILNIKTE